MFGGVTDEQLDLMTLEQVRMWTRVRQRTGASPGEVVASSESSRVREASNGRGLTREGMNHLVQPGTSIVSGCCRQRSAS